MGLADRIVVMKDGLVQQIGSPSELYDRPVNRFVAGFIGTPTMNFIEGDVERDGNGLALRWPGGRITLPAGITLATARAAIGIRPDTLAPVADGPFRGTVQSIEFLGDRADVLVESSGVRLNARVPTDSARAMREGESIALGMPSVAHVFDGDGQRAT